MKIWYLTSEFPPSYGGGIGMYVDIASKMMARAGHQVMVFTRGDGHKDQTETPEANLQYLRMACQGKIFSSLGYWTAVAYHFFEVMKKQVEKDSPPDIIETQEYNALGYYIQQDKLLGNPTFANTKIVVHCHTPTFELTRINHMPQYVFPEYWIGQMEKFSIRAADGLFFQSKFLKSRLVEIIPEIREKISAIIPLPYPIREVQLPAPETQDYILYMGRKEYRKGIFQFIQAMEMLWQKGETTRIVVVGGDTHFMPKDCSMGEIIEKKFSARVKEGQLQFCDTVPPEKLDEMIMHAKAVAVPSLYENFPYTNLIAMSLGAPMIVSRQGGQAEAVGEHGVNGLIFDWDIPGDCEEKLKQLLAMPQEKRRSMGKNAQNRVQALCNLEENGPLRLALYEKVLSADTSLPQYPFGSVLPLVPPVALEDSTKGLLSIIIPYYNLGETIDETMQSVLVTAYPHVEILIVNDGSTDEKSLLVLQEIRKNFPQVRIIDIENGGLANARNVGVQHAKGEFVTFLDADDMVKADYYSKCVSVLQRYPNVGFVYSWLQYFEGAEDVWTSFDTSLPYMLLANQLSAFLVLRRSLFLSFARNREIMEYGMEDYDAWLGLVEHGHFGVCLPEALCLYRVRKESMARGMTLKSRLYSYQCIQEGHASLYTRFGGEIMNLINSNGPSVCWNNPTWPAAPQATVAAPVPTAAPAPEQIQTLREVHALETELEQLKKCKWLIPKRVIDKLFYS